MRAQDVASAGTQYEFWFLADPRDERAAYDAVDQLEHSKFRSGSTTLTKVAKGKGTLVIVSSDIEPSTAGPGGGRGTYGSVRRIAFRVSLIVPPAFVPDRKLKARSAPCFETRDAWFTEWSLSNKDYPQ